MFFALKVDFLITKIQPLVTRQYLHTTTSCPKKVVPSNLKGKSKGSQEWLTRQLNDPYVLKARTENYRARSAYKLIEIDDKHKILRPGQVVIDCGASPGSWSQVVVKRVNGDGKDVNQRKGLVVAVDLIGIYPIDGVTIVPNSDFTSKNTQNLIHQVLDGRKVDVILSDMAPNASGVHDLDYESILTLVYAAIEFSIGSLKRGGTLLFKIWEGGREKQIEQDLLQFYEKVTRVKPNASRSDSSEKFLIASKFKGITSVPPNV